MISEFYMALLASFTEITQNIIEIQAKNTIKCAHKMISLAEKLEEKFAK